MSSNENHIISLDNYEEWFILYVDDELSANEKVSVESFLLLHPHLQEEMDLLVGTKLPVDAIVFEGKAELHAEAMKLNTVDEALLLYLDNELPAAGRKAVEEKLDADKDCQLQFLLLQQTKFDATETLPFPNKAELYRHTQKVNFFPSWMRIAVAIVLLLFGALFVVFNRENKPAGYASAELKPAQPNSVRTPEDNVDVPAVHQQQTAIVKPETVEKTTEKPGTKTPAVLLKKEASLQQLTSDEQPFLAQTVLPKTRAVERMEAVKVDMAKLNEQPTLALNNAVANPVVTSASGNPYNEIDNPDGPEDGDYKPTMKTPAKGFLRKVSRFIERRTGVGTVNADNELLVGAVAFKLN